MKMILVLLSLVFSISAFADAVKLSTLTALKDFYTSETPKRAFLAIQKDQVSLYSNRDLIAYVAIPDALNGGFKQQENFNDFTTWNVGTKSTEFVGFMIPVSKNEEIAGSSIKIRANFDGQKVTIYEETFGNHSATIKTQIKNWLNTNIPVLDVF